MSEHYPHTPGWKARDTSIAAAKAMAPKASDLQTRVLAEIIAKPGTAEQIADRLGEPWPNIRPRASELSTMGLIRASGRRDVSAGGRLATVWEAVKAGEDPTTSRADAKLRKF